MANCQLPLQLFLFILFETTFVETDRMYPYKITLVSQEVFNLSLLIQKIRVTFRRVASLCYYNNMVTHRNLFITFSLFMHHVKL